MVPQAPSVDAAISALGYADAPGLVVAGASQPADLTTRFMWEEIAEKVPLSAVFFQSGVPVVGFTAATASDLRALRQQLWNYGRLPALVSLDDNKRLTVYNAQRSPSDGSATAGVLATSDLLNAHRDLIDFSRREVEAGSLARTYGNSFRVSERVDSVLLANLRILRLRLSQNGGPEVSAQADVVIGASILAAYLADRQVLTAEHLQSLCGQSTLGDALRAGSATFAALLSGLAQRFNGDVFGPAATSVRHLRGEHLGYIARFLSGEHLATGQGALWEYDFSAIPPELISSVYETLLEEDRRKHASFYTPRAVVNLILDEVMPLDRVFEGTIVDLSCGSGAFLTEAFRRIVFQRRVRGSAMDYQALSRVLSDHIYGVDVDDFATRLTIFGLYLALLEHVQPRTIWNEVVLPRLYRRNIIHADAFTNHALSERQFDVVVGNPPWQSALSADATRFLRNQGLSVGDQQLAQAFVWLASHVLRDGGLLGLVLPAKSILYNRSQPNREFRRQIFARLGVRTIIDLSLMRRSLFTGAIGPSVVIVARTGAEVAGEDQGVYLSVRPRLGVGILDGFVAAPEDFKEFSSNAGAGDELAWKVFLWGGRRDLELLRRLRDTFVPLDLVAEPRGWQVAQGIKEAGLQRDATDLLGLPTLGQSDLGQLRLPRLDGEFQRDTLHRRQSRRFFESPKVVVGRTLSNQRIATAVLTSPAIFTSNLTGIVVGNENLAEIQILGLIASSSVIQYWQFFTSASWGVERPTVETNEIRAWPIPPFSADTLAEAEMIWRAVDVTGITTENRPIVDAFVSNLYGLTQSERILVAAGVERSISADRPTDVFQSVVSEQGMSVYRDALLVHLSTGWDSVEPRASIKVQGGYAGVKVQFRLSNLAAKADQLEWTADEWARVVSSVDPPASTTAVISQPSVLYLDDTTAYLVKSRDADRWSPAAALNDGDGLYAAVIFGMQDAP